MNLGELINQLANFSPSAYVYIDASPVALSVSDAESYRGYYDDLALNVEATRDAKYSSVSALLELLRGKLGGNIHGYKGGKYLVTSETRVWISNYGEVSDARVTGVKPRGKYDGDNAVVITWTRDE